VYVRELSLYTIQSLLHPLKLKDWFVDLNSLFHKTTELFSLDRVGWIRRDSSKSNIKYTRVLALFVWADRKITGFSVHVEPPLTMELFIDANLVSAI
jgi:hypothetical protein